jgi:hypothetical protein
LDFAFVPEFLVATSLLEPAEVCRTELKPFLTIIGTSMRATFLTPSIPLNIMTFPFSVSGFLVFSPELLPARAWLLMRCQFLVDRSAIFMNSESVLKIMI